MTRASEAWREKSIDVTEEATLLIYRAIESIPNEDDRFAVLKEIVVNTTSVSVSQSLLLDLLEHAQLWASGKVKVPSQPGSFFQKQLVRTTQLEDLRRLWLQAAWQVGVSTMFEKEPIPVSNLFRMAQLDESPEEGYRRVQEAMGEYWRQFLQQVVQLKEPRDVIDKFREALESLESHDDRDGANNT